MVSIDSDQEKNLKVFASKKYRYILSGLLLGLFFFYFIKSCSILSIMDTNYSIGQNSRWPDIHLMGNERNFTAFNNELLAAIAKQEHFLVHSKFSTTLLEDLQQGKLDGILTLIPTNYPKDKELLFSDVIYLTGPVLITPLMPPTDGWNEMRKKIIGIPSTQPHLLNLEQDTSIQVKLYSDILLALADLSENRIDGIIFPVIPAYVYTTTFYKEELKIGTLPLTSEGVRLVTLKNQEGQELIDKFNEGLKALKEDGTYAKLLKQWGLISIEEVAEVVEVVEEKENQ